MNKAKVLLIALVVVLVAAVASLLPRGGKQENEVLVLCGGSMRAALEEIVDRYGKVSTDRIMTAYGGSGELCAQIQKIQKGDVYICHDPFMPWAQKQGLIHTWKTVAHLDIVVVVPKGNRENIKELKDLARPGLRLGIGDQRYSTSGQIVKHMLKKLEFGDALLKNVLLETKGHQSRCTDVAMGLLDAAIVWNAVAHQFRDKLDIIPIPKENIDAVTSATYTESDLKNVKVTVGVTSFAKDKEHVRRFYEFVTTQGKDVFREYGFTPLGN